MPIDLSRVAVILTTWNSSRFFDKFPGPVLQQGIRPDQVLIVDSESKDNTVERARSFGFGVHQIPRLEFNHGGTRALASTMVPWADFLVYTTPDAIMATPDTLKTILAAFEDPQIGAAYGRQLPHEDADLFAIHHCACNYPATSWVREYADRATYAYKTVYLSNSFTAYRRTALDSVGGFPRRIIGSEDFYVGARLLKQDWKIAYVADSTVYHSHNQTLEQVFRRFFDIGVMQSEQNWILEEYGKPAGSGMRFMKSEVSFLLTRDPLLTPMVFARTIAKYLGYQLGRRHRSLSSRTCMCLANFREYWAVQA